MANMEKICRICTFGIRHTKKTRQKFYGIFDECDLLKDIDELAEPIPYIIIKQFFNKKFSIGENDDLPNVVCPNCIERFIEMYDLLKTCEKSQKILEKKFNVKLNMEPDKLFCEALNTNIVVKEEIVYDEIDEYDIDKMEFDEIDIPKINISKIDLPLPSISNHEIIIEKSRGGTKAIKRTYDTRKRNKKEQDKTNLDDYTNYEILETPEASYQIKKIEIANEANNDYDFAISMENNDDYSHSDNADQVQEKIIKLESDSEDEELVKQVEADFNTFTCQYCLLDFKTMENLDEHVTRKHKSKLMISKIQCEDCGELIKRNDFEDHYQVKHVGMKPYFCEDCKKTYINMRSYRMHMHNIHNKDLFAYNTNFICTVCNRTMFNKGALDRHMKSHNSELIGLKSTRNFHCKVCSQKFYNKTTMEQHHLDRHVLGTNKDKYKHKCQECSRVFTRGDHLQIHIKREHLLDLPYKCQFCTRAYPVPNLLNRHVKLKHSEDYDERIKCHECDRILPDPRILRRHIAEFHSDTPQFKCILCGLQFFKRALLQRHAKLHNIEGLSDEKIAELSKSYSAATVLALRTRKKSVEIEKDQNEIEVKEKTTIERVNVEDMDAETEMLLHDLIEVDPE